MRFLLTAWFWVSFAGTGFGVTLDSLIEASPFVPEGFGNAAPPRPEPAYTQQPIEEIYELRGVMQVGGKRMYSLWHRDEQRSTWVEEGASTGGFFPEVMAFEPIERRAQVRLGDRRAVLELPQAEWTPADPRAEKRDARDRDRDARATGREDDAEDRAAARNPTRRVIQPVARRTIPGAPRNGANANSDESSREQDAIGPDRGPPPAPRPFIGRRLPNTEADDGADVGDEDSEGEEESPVDEAGDEAVAEGEVVLEAPEDGPPPAPTTPPPSTVPQLPPGFDLEAYLRERNERLERGRGSDSDD